MPDPLHRGPDNDGLDEGTVSEALEDFLGDVGGGLPLDQTGRLEIIIGRKPGPEIGRKVGHRLRGLGPAGVEPFEDLTGPVARMAIRDQSLAEGLGSFAVD